jgi:hypothetical protein
MVTTRPIRHQANYQFGCCDPLALLLALQMTILPGDDGQLGLMADKRCIRTARAEGLPVNDPEDAQPPVV